MLFTHAQLSSSAKQAVVISGYMVQITFDLVYTDKLDLL